MQYIVGANCFAPKIYCIEFAVRKKVVKENRSVWRKKQLFQTIFLLTNMPIYCVVPGCTSKQYGKRNSHEKISFHR
jgi:hypothetical protein